MERKQHIMHTIKTAYMNNAPFGDRVPSADDVRAGAQTFIEANYAYQRALYGKIRLKLSIWSIAASTIGSSYFAKGMSGRFDLKRYW